VVGLLSSFAAYFSFQLFLSDSSLRSSLGDPGVLRGVVGGALYLTVLGLFGLGLGAILRRSAPAIAAVFVVLFVPPFLLEVLPGSWFEAISPYVPLEAGSQIYALRHDGGALGAWQGFAVFCLYAAAALAAGCLLMRRRDA
ncbi:MAG: ABC transporter permease, partial [Tepidiformaceae bacterium]